MLTLALPAYLLTSFLLFVRPSLLHSRHLHPPLIEQALDGRKTVRIAHRGGTRKAIENTIAAFEHSSQCADMLEMDVIETKDGVLVVHHDKDLMRTCGVEKDVGDFNRQELPPFQNEVLMHFTSEQLKSQWEGETIPTLQEVFTRYPSMPMSVQIKYPSVSAIKELKRLVLKHNRTDITILGVASPYQTILQQQFPQSSRFISYGALPKLLLLYLTGLLPFIPIKEKVLQMPLFTRDYQISRTNLLGDSWSNWLFFMMVQASYHLCRPLIWHLRQRGIPTLFWVCNREEDYQRAIEAGGCGIMTDDPELLSAYLQRNQKDE